MFCCWLLSVDFSGLSIHAQIQRRDMEPQPPLKNHKNIGFLSSTSPGLLKNHKVTQPTFNVGPSLARQGNTIKMAFPWRADGGLLLVLFGSPLSLSPHKKNPSELDPLWQNFLDTRM